MKRLVLAAALAGFATTAAAADLKICVEGAYPPFSETTASGDIVGFDIDIANALCASMGKSCEMVKTEWDGIIPALIEGKCDAIVASMSITEDRMKVIDFTNKYYQTPAKFISKADAGLVDTPEGLKGKVVGVQRGTIHQDFMEGEFPDVELKLYGTQDEAYLDLQAGRIDAVIADSVAMDDGFLKTENGKGYAFFGKDYSIPKYHGEGAGIGVRKSDGDLKAALNAAIDAIRASGEYKTINDKYFDFDLYGA
ncbi:transporter substrate-binding domain-containing protein [Limibaculum sp. M0105]|uniref:Transporter substrate-binding domain-containing protein n=1 Tax=Thermohalobaculum xanthum TaxID=2753746 RepID=A0A8J7SHE7_9RHOB|nr:lysine/arginine/ornithine ABC transporter substrate-binding protein [Thermohalobaculum xanthum]MBK0400707.1 transporter substrate-binding domain-containing protein [Thermohalobaculum xanthum]